MLYKLLEEERLHRVNIPRVPHNRQFLTWPILPMHPTATSNKFQTNTFCSVEMGEMCNAFSVRTEWIIKPVLFSRFLR